jgi:hypothetical protein
MDKYDKAIAYLSDHPDEIMEAWKRPHKHVAGCLFQKATKTGWSCVSGCLTELRRWPQLNAATDALTDAIRADRRIPMDPYDITVERLGVFAEWQRRLDQELRGDGSNEPFNGSS